ncbi:MAG: lytic transglycosylase domain-containing protein [Candidatus Promineifilaceae bacterium]
MHKLRLVIAALALVAALLVASSQRAISVAEGGGEESPNQDVGSVLSPFWGPVIRQWAPQIAKEAQASGLDPDLIAAVIQSESNGFHSVVSRAGAVGLMGVMPAGPGMEWRPSGEALLDPEVNLNWGVAILADIIRQSGGDIDAALAAYIGGWDQVSHRVPREYASRVLNDYGRAVAVRSNISPDIATRWTIAIEVQLGHVPPEALLMSERPVSGLRKYGEHIVYQERVQKGWTSDVKGYAVPLALVVPLEPDLRTTGSDTVDTQLLARLGLDETKLSDSNPRLILACLPTLNRLRGQLATRWYSPSGCPGWRR